jgi:hypothetical protein
MNKLSIVPNDFAVYVDGIAIVGLDLSFVPFDVHALQWNKDNGTIERFGQADEIIQTLPDWANQALDLWTTTKHQIDNPPPPTDDEKKAALAGQAIGLLNESDWTMLPDVTLTNKTEWQSYRATLRMIAQNPQVTSIIPTKPQEIWA